LVVNWNALTDWAVTHQATAEANWTDTDEMTAVEWRAGDAGSQEGGQLAARTDGTAGVVRREDGRGTSWAAGALFTTAQSRAASTRAGDSTKVRRHAVVIGR